MERANFSSFQQFQRRGGSLVCWRDKVSGSKTPEAGLAGALFARAGLGLGMHSADACKLQISLPTNPTKRVTRM